MTSKEYLIEARALISNPDNWVKYRRAANAAGETTGVGDGCRFCALGAISRVVDDTYVFRRLERTLAAAARKFGFGGVAHLNDNSNHVTVMKMFDLAIAAA